jgi:ankyrin repeat protein
LLDKGASAQTIGEAFVEAARHGQIEPLRLLIKRGVDLKKAGPGAAENAVGVRVGTEQEMAETVNFLLDLGIDVNSRTKEGKTLLQAAAYDGYPAVAKTLIERGADVNARDKDGATALWWTAGVGRREAAALLIDKGADVNAKANDGTTPLARAKSNNDKQMIALLLSHGAE